MSAQALGSDGTQARPRSLVHILSLLAVWLMAATSGLVFSEPCLTDALGAGLILLLPVVGLIRVSQTLSLMFMLWMTLGILALIACIGTADTGSALKHTAVSFFLYGITFVMAGFIACNPLAHVRIIMNGWLIAALIAAVAGLIGYFGVLPGSEIFTKFGRASGTFKDPNVFGPFLVPALLLALHAAINRPLSKALWPLTVVAILALALLLSFSRGAWLNFALATVIYLGLLFVFAPGNALRRRIVVLSLAGVAILALGVAAVMQIDQVANLAEQRVSAGQSYDVGPEGRFGGQQKAIKLVLENPLGLGAQQFALFHHHEEPHNVFINMFLNTGWVGGILYQVMIAVTLYCGLTALRTANRARPFLMIALAAFIANVAEGVIIDTDHWRHFYMLMAIIWGLATAQHERPEAVSSANSMAFLPRQPKLISAVAP